MSRFRSSVPLTQDRKHFEFAVSDGAARRFTLNRSRKLSALTFEAYADLRDLLAELEAITQALMMQSSDHREFFRAWNESRRPEWQDR